MGTQQQDHRAFKKRLKRAAFRLEMAQLERTWAVVSASQQGLSVREIAAEVSLSATRVHQILADRSAEITLQALSLLREMGWPAPEDSDDGEVVADRLVDEAALLATCAEWLEKLASGGPGV